MKKIYKLKQLIYNQALADLPFELRDVIWDDYHESFETGQKKIDRWIDHGVGLRRYCERILKQKVHISGNNHLGETLIVIRDDNAQFSRPLLIKSQHPDQTLKEMLNSLNYELLEVYDNLDGMINKMQEYL